MRVALLVCLALMLVGCKVASSKMPETYFDGNRAFEHLKAQVAIGFRVPGSPEHVKGRDYILNELKKLGYAPTIQPFSHLYKGKKIQMWNIIAYSDKKASRQIMLSAHWDTRPTADNDMNPSNRNTPIQGANDGASGVAVLLEMAKVIKDNPPQVGVVFVFFDGEDLADWPANMLLGSKFFARNIPSPKPEKGILFDMVGDKDLTITREAYSLSYAPALMNEIFAIAEKLDYSKEFPAKAEVMAIDDDHVPLNKAGIPTIDLIDFTYPYWHTTQDTVDKCSPKSLEIVGTVVEAWLRMQQKPANPKAEK